MVLPDPAPPSIRIAALLMLALAAGCAINRAPPPPQSEASPDVIAAASPQPAAAQAQPAVVEPVQSGASQTAAVEPSQPVAPENAVTAAKPAVPPATPSAGPSKEHKAVRADTPAAKTPAKISPAPAQPRENESSPAQAKLPEASPPLDVATLEQRLKDSKAIGVFTKIALKNQVDDLLNQFRAFYQGRLKTTLAALRQPYDMLLLKVLALLQDGDPPLARTIAASREAIWGILADRDKFNSLD